MARDDAPPFDRGSTFYNGGTIDSNNLGGTQHEGKKYTFEDLDYSVQGAKPARTNRNVTCMIVRNVSGIALLPKRIANLQASGVNFCGRIDGYARLDAAYGFPIDEWLPAAGVPNNDLCYIVIEGPARVLTDLATGQGNVINVGERVVALTAVTSQATTAGRVQSETQFVSVAGTAATGQKLADVAQNALGFALSAKTTNNTNADLLIDVRKW